MPTTHANLLIRSARLIDPSTNADKSVDVLVEDGIITSIGSQISSDHATTINANGSWLLPGLVDIGATAPSFEAVAKESLAAASGGVTHLAVLPGNNTLDSTANLRLLREKAAHADRLRLLPIAALTRDLLGNHLTDMYGLASAGAIAFSNAQHPIVSNLVLKRCMEYAATFDLLVTFCPQDHDLSVGGCAHLGAVSSRLGLAGIPPSAETLALSRALLLAEETGVRIHFHHLSSALSLPLIKRARERNVRVSCDVSIHHLLADEHSIDQFDSDFHIMPPLRRREDKDALLAAVADGTIDAICSQHTPLASADKQQPFAATLPGISAVECLLPLLLKLVNEGHLTLTRAIDAVTNAPAKIFGIDAGRIYEGKKANLCLVDANSQQHPADHWLSTGENSPWKSLLLPGKLLMTLGEGRITWQG